MEQQFISLLRQSANEITSLRKSNELMNARLSMFDSIMTLLHTSPNYPGHGMSEDLVWKINQFIESEEKQP